MKKDLKIEQQSLHDCGAACLCSVAQWHGVRISLAKARLLCGCTKEGITIKGLIEGGNKLGFSCKAYKSPDRDSSSLADSPLPAIIHTKTEDGMLHFMVLYSINKESYMVMDPAKGEFIKLGRPEFCNIWTGYIITFTPSGHFKRRDEKGNTYLKLLKLAYLYKWEILFAIAGTLITTMIGISSSIFLQQIIDNAIPNGDISTLTAISATIIILAIMGLCINYLKNICITTHGIKIDNHLITRYVNKLAVLPLEFFNRYQPGDISSRIGDAFNIRLFLSDGIVSIATSLFTLAVAVPIMFHYNTNLALLSLAFIPVYIGLFVLSGPINKKHNRHLAESGARFETDLLHGIEGIACSRHYSAENLSIQKIKGSYSKLAKNLYKAAKAGIILGCSAEAVSKGMISAIIVSGGFAVFNNSITIGELVSFYTLCSLFCTPLSNLTGLNPIITQAAVSAERLYEILELEEEDTYLHKGSDREKYRPGNIRINKLTFSYPGCNQLFKELDLNIPKGEITLLNGAAGCGKSTLVSLIMRDYRIDNGAIFCGDTDISTIPIGQWRRYVSIVPQKCYLFNASILENITCGEENPDMERVIQICRSTGLEDKIAGLPAGLLTHIGEEGMLFSGGETQKLAIARLLYKNPEIMIFDESTSSMDKESELLMADIIKELKKNGKTIIIISHNSLFKTIADNIMIIQ